VSGGPGNVMSSGERWVLGLAGVALLASAAVARHPRRRTTTAPVTTSTALGTRLDSVSPHWATRRIA
jgi:hypothetical protein